jgi:hypothetical protein
MFPSRLVILVVAVMGAACTTDTEPSVPTRVLSPAPSPSGEMSFCPFGTSRASSIPPESLADVMANHVPASLPAGMGLVGAFGPSEGSPGGAYFADAQCREIQLWFWDSSELGDGERMGPWAVEVSGPGDCGNSVLGSSRCIEYHAAVDGGSIGVQMMGLERAEGDKIVQSIPL